MHNDTDGIAGLLTLKAAAALFRVTPQTIGERIRRYQVPTVRIGRNILVSVSALRATYGADAPRWSERA